MGMNRGGNRGGRGGGMYNNMGGRGGGPGQGGGSFRGHGQNRGFGNRDNRRGGSFNAGPGPNFPHGNPPQQPSSQQPPHHPQQGFSGSFRGRNQGYANNHGRSGRHESAGIHKESSTSSAISSGKKEENRRTLTDFKIVGLEIQDLDWSWGTVPKSSGSADVKEESDESQVPPQSEVAESQSAEQKPVVDSNAGTEGPADAADATAAPSEQSTTSDAPVKTETGSVLPPPPSRIRIYFHTPVTADDAHAVSTQPSFSHGPSSESSVRKGKRKKLEDDDGDIEDGRGPPPPPPQHSGFDHEESNNATGPDYEGTESVVGRSSVAPSVAETTSEADWLMAAIGEEETEGGDGEHHPHGPETDDMDAEGEPDDYDGKHHSCMAETVQRVDATLGFLGCVLTANFPFLLEGNDYDEVDAQMQVADSDPVHFEVDGHHPPHDDSAAAHDSGSVPPGLNGHHDSSHDQQHGQPSGDQNGGADANAPSAPPEDKDNVPMVPPESDSDTSLPAEPAAATAVAAEPAIPVIEPVSQSTAEANGHSSTQTDAEINDATAAPTLSQSASTATVLDAETEPMESPPTPPATQMVDGQPASQELRMEPTEILEPKSEAIEADQFTSSQTSPTLMASSVTTVAASEELVPQIKVEAEGSHVPSANRLSISYAAGTRRMVINAGVVDKLKVFRSDARIEVHMNISEDSGRLKGILVSAFSATALGYPAHKIIRWRGPQRVQRRTLRLKSPRTRTMTRPFRHSGGRRYLSRQCSSCTSTKSVRSPSPDGLKPATSRIG